MGLLQNGFRDNLSIFKIFGAGVSNGAIPQECVGNYHLTGQRFNITDGEGITSEQVAIPMGYNPGVAWKPARKSGQLSARMHDIVITATASGVLGMPGGGSTSISITTDNFQVLPLDTTSPVRTGSTAIELSAEATGELKVSGAGSSGIELTANADCVGVLWAEGNADISISVAGVTIGAIAEIIGVTTISITGSLVPYAIGQMIGSTTSTGGELTAPQVAAEVVNALLGTTIPVDTKKIAGVLVGGVGTELDPWGPA